MQKLFQKLHNRALPFLLAVLMLASSLPLNVLSIGADTATDGTANGIPSPDGYIYDYDTLKITKDGKETYAMDLLTHEKITISADGLAEDATYQWQIRHNENDNTWINIYDATEKELPVTLALLGNLLRDDHTAMLRCRAYTDTYAYLTSPITVTVKEPTETKITIPTPTQTTKDPSFKAGGVDEFEFVTVTVQYVRFDFLRDDQGDMIKEGDGYKLNDGTEAFSSYIATLVRGNELDTTVTFPTLVGYEAFWEGETTPTLQKKFDKQQINESLTFTVSYKPALVDYSIRYFFQNVYDDKYIENPSLLEEYSSKGYTGSTPEDNLLRPSVPGFTALYYHPDSLAADGSTVFEVYYERNYYLMEFDCNGGYGTETLYVRYGSYIAVPDPVNHGYVFAGWDLAETVLVDGRTEYKYDGVAIPLPQTMPPYNSAYRAIWETSKTTYTVVYWAENANDTNYSYWGTVLVGGTRNAEGEIEPDGSVFSATLVSGANHSTAPSSLKDYQYFTYNEKLTLYKESQRDDLQDGKVIVEGDGSTVVNVYFSRNVYTITFTDSSADGCQINEHQHTEECYTYICDSHVHVPACYICGKEENPHTSACCSLAHDHASCELKNCMHQHDITCYTSGDASIAQNAANNGFNIIKQNYPDPEEGKIYRYRRDGKKSSTYYNYVYVGGQWYALANGNGNSVSGLIWQGTNPTSSGAIAVSSYTNTPEDCSHIHEDACYSCGKKAHNHESGCNSVNCSDPSHHSHSVACLGCTSSHVHTSACPTALICEKGEHSHSSDTYGKKIVKILSRKYGSDIGDEWNFTTDKGTTYPKGDDISSWNPDETSSLFEERLSLIYIMPGESFELRYDPQSDRTKKYYKYLVECLEGEEYDIQYKGRNYKYYFDFETLVVDFNYYTKAEDFFDFQGFTKQIAILDGSEIKNNGDLDKDDIVYFYYTRNQYKLKYFNHNDFIKDGSTDLTETLQYETPLQSYELTKAYMEANHYPSTLEPGAYEFAGWYTTAGCFDGTEVDWAKNKMPDGDLTLYAKWTPIVRTVTFYSAFSDIKEDQDDTSDKIYYFMYADNVPHGTNLGSAYLYTPDYPTDKTLEHAQEGDADYNESQKYDFVGWFYMDENNKKRFAPDSMEVTKNLVLFAEWQTAIDTTYEIKYVLKNAASEENTPSHTEYPAGTEIAEKIEAHASVGQTKTFEAKAGSALLPDFRKRFFPTSNSHSILMEVEPGKNTYSFEYVFDDKVYYKIRYLEQGTNEELAPPFIGDTRESGESIITVKFKPIKDYLPTSYYITRSLQYDGTADAPIEENTFTFYYVKDTVNGLYSIEYYWENVDSEDASKPENYTMYESTVGKAEIGTKISADDRSYDKFGLVKVPGMNTVITYKDNGEEDQKLIGSASTGDPPGGTVSNNGLTIQVYYRRKAMAYTIQYVEYGGSLLHQVTVPADTTTNTNNWTPKVDSNVKVSAPDTYQVGDVTYYFYPTPDRPQTQTHKIRKDAEDNVITFYYKLKDYTIQYIPKCTVEGLTDFGFASPNMDYVSRTTDIGGSTATPLLGFRFVNWRDQNGNVVCTDPYWKPTSFVGADATDHIYYYAYFEPVYSKLSITKALGTTTQDTFLFHIKGQGKVSYIDIVVSIQGPGTIVLEKVPVGTYTVTELANWSWEYTCSAVTATGLTITGLTNGAQFTLGETGGTVTFTNTPDPSNWLNGETVNENQFNP